MTRRELGFLLTGMSIGVTIGLILIFILVLRVNVWMHHMFIFGINREAYLWTSLPFLFLAAGLLLIGQWRRI